ncbi:MAG: UbiA family prenyltransferase [Candidatus Nanoarchaeia archaeon]|jgi:heme O synthase-like polyprenyltransferase
MSFIRLFIDSTKPKVMVQKNAFYFLLGYFISVFYYQQFTWLKALLALTVFISVYSCVYVINDIFDYKRDRAHPIKCHRPIPSNQLKPSMALLFCGIVYIAGFLASILFINPLFATCIFLLIVGNIVYSHPYFKTKKSIVNSAIILGLLQYLKLLAGWSITAGQFAHPFLLFLIPGCLYLYSMLQLAINSDHYKGRFKIARRELLVGRTLMIAPAVLITILLFTELTSYIMFIMVPVYLAFLFIVEKLKLSDAIKNVNKYMGLLNSLLISLNLLYFIPLL